MRRYMTGMLLLVLLLALSACGGGTSADGGETQETQTAAGETQSGNAQSGDTQASADTGGEPATDEPATRTVRHAKGEVEIPAHPQNIAVIDVVAFEDNLLALGVKPSIAPVFAWSEAGFLPYLAEQLEGAQGIDGVQPNMEQLLAMAPDLIIIEERHADSYDLCAKIAPTVIVSSDSDWRVRLRHLAEIVDRTDEAERLLQQYDERLGEIRDAVRSAVGDDTVVLANLQDEKTIRVQGTSKHAFNEMIYQDLGLRPAEGVPADALRTEVSLEGFLSMEPDRIFLQKDRSKTVDEMLDYIKGHELLSGMRAAADQHVYVLEEPLTMSWGFLGRNLLLDQIYRDLAG